MLCKFAPGTADRLFANMENHTALRLLISGVVQGVGYRRWLQREAEARGVDGWVRNRTNGTVEAVLAGSQGQVGVLVILCHDGPGRAKVSRVVTRKRERPVRPGFVRRKRFGARAAAPAEKKGLSLI